MQISESEAHRDDILPNSWYIFLAATVSTPLNQQSVPSISIACTDHRSVSPKLAKYQYIDIDI